MLTVKKLLKVKWTFSSNDLTLTHVKILNDLRIVSKVTRQTLELLEMKWTIQL